MNWLKRMLSNTEKGKDINASEPLTILHADVPDGSSDHYSDSVEIILALKREGKIHEAIDILISCVEATEAESKKYSSTFVVDNNFSQLSEGRFSKSMGVAPWYYEQLAILYRKNKQYLKEIEILERYEKQEKAPGTGPQKLAVRLMKARELLGK